MAAGYLISTRIDAGDSKEVVVKPADDRPRQVTILGVLCATPEGIPSTTLRLRVGTKDVFILISPTANTQTFFTPFTLMLEPNEPLILRLEGNIGSFGGIVVI